MENQDNLTSLYLQLREFEKNKSSLAELKKKISEKEFEKREAFVILEKKLKDFKSIKNIIISSLFYFLTGSKGEKIEKKEKDYLTAKLKFYELADEISIIYEKVESTQNKLLKSESFEIEFNKLLSVKEKEILKLNSLKKLELTSLNSKILKTQSNLNSSNEILAISERTTRALERV